MCLLVKAFKHLLFVLIHTLTSFCIFSYVKPSLSHPPPPLFPLFSPYVPLCFPLFPYFMLVLVCTISILIRTERWRQTLLFCRREGRRGGEKKRLKRDGGIRWIDRVNTIDSPLSCSLEKVWMIFYENVSIVLYKHTFK